MVTTTSARSRRRRTARSLRSAGAAALACILIATGACSDDDPEVSADVCAEVSAVRDGLQTMREVDVVEDGTDALVSAADELEVAFQDLGDAARDAFGDELTDVQNAFEDLRVALNKVPDAESPSDAAATVKDSFTVVKDKSAAFAQKVDQDC